MRHKLLFTIVSVATLLSIQSCNSSSTSTDKNETQENIKDSTYTQPIEPSPQKNEHKESNSQKSENKESPSKANIKQQDKPKTLYNSNIQKTQSQVTQTSQKTKVEKATSNTPVVSRPSITKPIPQKPIIKKPPIVDTNKTTIPIINKIPIALADSITMNEDNNTLINLLQNDSDAENKVLHITNLTSPSHGIVVLEENMVRYTPIKDYFGTDSFTYTVNDGSNDSNQTDVNITILPINDRPIAKDESITIAEDGEELIDVLANDSDKDGDQLKITNLTQPSHGAVLLIDNKVYYQPQSNYAGKDSFTYTINDGIEDSAPVTVTINVSNKNDTPITNEDQVSLLEDEAIVIDVLANDSDIEGDTLLIRDLTQPNHGITYIKENKVYYKPNQDFNGIDTFTYQASDGSNSSTDTNVTLTITAVNDAPITVTENIDVIEDTLKVIDVLSNDTDVDNNTLTISNLSTATQGMVSIVEGKIHYMPNNNATGIDRFTYTANDGTIDGNTATVIITINAVNDAPTVSLISTKNIYTDQDLKLHPTINDDTLDGLHYEWKDKSGTIVSNEKNLYISAPLSAGISSYIFTVIDKDGLSTTKESTITVIDAKSKLEDHGIALFSEDKSIDSYKLESIDDSTFNALSKENQYKVADKLLSSLFFTYPHQELVSLIESGSFISTIEDNLKNTINDMDSIEERINDKSYYYNHEAYKENMILSRFYEMQSLDKSYLDHWISYILTQTILFSPAVELGTVARPDLEGVYNRLYTLQSSGMGMRYATYLHMQSTENWRRFRSPEDNGREMLEIYALDAVDSHVPLAAKALQNWHLSDNYSDTLMVGLNKNTEPLDLQNGIAPFKSGLDFFAEITKSPNFIHGATTRLVNFMFTNTLQSKKESIISKIENSAPETWTDILKQILLSKTYLLETKRVKSIEELALPTMKNLYYNTYYYTFNTLRSDMAKMNQASMQYKLGKLNRVPIDDISFANYKQHFRSNITRSWSRDMENAYNPNSVDETHNLEYFQTHRKSSYNRGISSKNFLDQENYTVVEDDIITTNKNYINHIFNAVLNRDANEEELNMFINQINHTGNWYANHLLYINTDLDYQKHIRLVGAHYIDYLVLEYILRLSEFYFYEEIK